MIDLKLLILEVLHRDTEVVVDVVVCHTHLLLSHGLLYRRARDLAVRNLILFLIRHDFVAIVIDIVSVLRILDELELIEEFHRIHHTVLSPHLLIVDLEQLIDGSDQLITLLEMKLRASSLLDHAALVVQPDPVQSERIVSHLLCQTQDALCVASGRRYDVDRNLKRGYPVTLLLSIVDPAPHQRK